MDLYNLVQMADDTILASESQETLASKFEGLCTFSNRKFQAINNGKTMHVRMSKFPNAQAIKRRNETIIKSLDYGESTCYPGMYLLHTSSLIINYNLDKSV